MLRSVKNNPTDRITNVLKLTEVTFKSYVVSIH